jgi:hypothetical protein
MICFLVFSARNIPLRRKAYLALFAFLLGLALAVPWMLRNRRAGAGLCLETNQANSLLDQAIMIRARAADIPPERLRNEWRREIVQTWRSEDAPSQKALYDLKMKRFFETLRRHPLRFVFSRFDPAVLLPDAPVFFELLGKTRHGRGTFFVLREHGMLAAVRHYFRGRMMLLFAAAPLLLVAFAAYAGCLLQAAAWVRKRQAVFPGFFIVYVLYFLSIPGPMTLPRYHLPALPFICVMAGLWFAHAKKGRIYKVKRATVS